MLVHLMWRADGAGRAKQSRLDQVGPTRGPHALAVQGDWRAAADMWERIGCPYERAEALADGDVPAMEDALQTFLALGASPSADRVRQRLRRAGVRRIPRGPRASTRSHPAGLTRRESEILALLAQNLSNPVIGERLFVSPKTVEHHVSAILGKLEVDTRDEAVANARRRGWLSDTTDPPAK